MTTATNKITTFPEMLTKLSETDNEDLLAWYNIIVFTYLTPSETNCLSAYAEKQLNGRRQRELSLIFGIKQPNLVNKTKKVLAKMRNLYCSLRRAKLQEQYMYAVTIRPDIEPILSAYLIGIPAIVIARRLHITPATVKNRLVVLVRDMKARFKDSSLCKLIDTIDSGYRI